MKISKSKQELARIISENGGWRDGAEFSALEERVGDVWFCKKRPKYKIGLGIFSFDDFIGAIDGRFEFANWHQTILSRAEYFHLYPAPDADGWIEWQSPFFGEMPVGEDEVVDIRVGDEVHVGFSAKDWKMWGVVTHYRLHKPEQVKPEFCESVMRSIPEPEYKPSIEQLMEMYADRSHSLQLAKEHLATCSKQASEAMCALSVACKAAGFDISPITAKQEPEMAITDWRQWKVGDYVSWSIISRRAEFKIISVHHDESREIGDFEITDEDGHVFRCYGDECKFIRRPQQQGDSMKEYMKMSGNFIGSVTINTDSQICDDKYFRGSTDIDEDYYAPICHAINSYDELVSEVGRLRQALIDAATSLETIHMRSYGDDSFLDSKHQMRSYAESRARVARQALSEQ